MAASMRYEGGRNAGGAFEGGGEGGSSDGDRVMWQGCEDAAGRLELATRGGGVPAGKRRRRRAGVDYQTSGDSSAKQRLQLWVDEPAPRERGTYACL